MTLPVGIDYEAPLHDLPVSRATWNLDAGRAAVLVHDLQRYFVTPFAEGCGEIGAVSATRLGGAGGGFPFERQYV